MISKIKTSFGGKLFVFFLIIGIQPLLFMTAAAYMNTNEMIKEKINSSIYENIKIVGNLLDSSLETFLNMARFISHSDDVKTLLNKEWSDGFESKFADVQKVYKLTNLLTAAHKNEVPVYIVGVKKYNRFSTTDHLPPIYATLKGEIFNQIDAATKHEVIYTQRRFDAIKSKDIVLTLGRKIRDDASDEVLGYVILIYMMNTLIKY